ncbi:MAG: hypothetical protein JWM33_639 [Caulobacteraceae bacterium]|nr:hypothetical protein [Caulobacteraceae bacterium]
MKILVTTWTLSEPTGAELYVRDLAWALGSRGHEVVIYAVNRGSLAEEVSEGTVRVVDNIREVGSAPDIIHGHHQPALIDALREFPKTPAVNVVHDATSPLDAPLVFERVLRHVAVDRRCLGRLLTAGIPAQQAEVILNFVDLKRFGERAPLPVQPGRALVFSNYAKTRADRVAIEAACRSAGLELDWAGEAAGSLVLRPEAMLGQYDVVFAKARAAIEAMAVGCAVVLCDFAGLGEMVTAGRFDHLRAWNFGAGVLNRPVTQGGLEAELARYDPADAAAVSRRIRGEAGLDQAAEAWLALYRQILAEPLPANSPIQARWLARAGRRWAGGRRAEAFRRRTRSLREAPGLAGAVYRLGRWLWRIVGSPGELVR